MNSLCRIAFRFVTLAFLLAASFATAQQPGKAPATKPGLNDSWRSPDVDALVGRLEVESREIYRERVKLAALVAPRPGSVIADIGAGSGFMVEEFAKLVGAKGKVYAIDINAKMMERVAARARQLGLANIETVVTREDSVDLAAASVDSVFICDTYHHFEYPEKSLAGIHRALRNGGELIIVDFHRVPGKTPDRLLEHVRAGQGEFTKEITAAGFTLIADHTSPLFSENYILRFRKK